MKKGRGKIGRKVFVALALSPIVNAAPTVFAGPVVTYTLSVDGNGSGASTPGDFAIYASDSTADGNGGLVTYGVGVKGFKPLKNLGPEGFYDDGTGSGQNVDMAFTDGFVRSASNVSPLVGAQETILASQGASGPGLQIWPIRW
jgi:hypothetical protein